MQKYLWALTMELSIRKLIVAVDIGSAIQLEYEQGPILN